MSIQILDPTTLPSNDNVPGNPYAYSLDIHPNEPWFTAKGAMIAYYGAMQFEPLSRTSMAAMVAAQFSSPLYLNDWVIANGYGKLVIGDRGFTINSYDLDDGNLTVRASNLLGFEPRLALKQSIVPGFVTLLGTGKFLASSNGEVMFVEPPVRVDPQALVGWADCPSPSVHFNVAWMHSVMGAAAGFFGMDSGEESQFDFTGAGTVLIQSSEKVISDHHLVRHMQAQSRQLSPSGLQELHQSIGMQLQQQA